VTQAGAPHLGRLQLGSRDLFKLHHSGASETARGPHLESPVMAHSGHSGRFDALKTAFGTLVPFLGSIHALPQIGRVSWHGPNIFDVRGHPISSPNARTCVHATRHSTYASGKLYCACRLPTDARSSHIADLLASIAPCVDLCLGEMADLAICATELEPPN
jgi:hypothetical protein